MAVGTLLAASATFGATAVGVVVYRQSKRAAFEAQATKVSAWLERVAGVDTFMAVVRNDSDLPIYDVTAGGVRQGLTTTTPWVLAQPVLPARQELRVGTPIPVIFPADAYQPLDVDFKDAAGHSWHRAGGVLQRRKSRPANVHLSG